MESTASLGQVMGPIIGSGLNYLLGYYIPLLGLTGLYWVCAAFFVTCIPSDDKLPNVGSTKKKASLPLGMAMKHYQVRE